MYCSFNWKATSRSIRGSLLLEHTSHLVELTFSHACFSVLTTYNRSKRDNK